MKVFETNHLVTLADLNHHQSLLAPRQAAWHMEAAFNAASETQGTALGIVARNINQMSYTAPGRGGDIVHLFSQVVHVGVHTMTVHTVMKAFNGKQLSESYITFATIEEGTSVKRAHGVVLDEPADEAEANARETAEKFLQFRL